VIGPSTALTISGRHQLLSDCEDYAILKYLALREAGISPDDLRLLIVSYPRRRTIHAVVCTENSDSHVVVMQSAEEWL
jgi:predicted transglutaminase-like cysteine proteinase